MHTENRKPYRVANHSKIAVQKDQPMPEAYIWFWNMAFSQGIMRLEKEYKWRKWEIQDGNKKQLRKNLLLGIAFFASLNLHSEYIQENWACLQWTIKCNWIAEDIYVSCFSQIRFYSASNKLPFNIYRDVWGILQCCCLHSQSFVLQNLKVNGLSFFFLIGIF